MDICQFLQTDGLQKIHQRKRKSQSFDQSAPQPKDPDAAPAHDASKAPPSPKPTAKPATQGSPAGASALVGVASDAPSDAAADAAAAAGVAGLTAATSDQGQHMQDAEA